MKMGKKKLMPKSLVYHGIVLAPKLSEGDQLILLMKSLLTNAYSKRRENGRPASAQWRANASIRLLASQRIITSLRNLWFYDSRWISGN